MKYSYYLNIALYYIIPDMLMLIIKHLYLHLRYGSHFYIPNISKPRTFNEHILKTIYSDDLSTKHFKKIVDKLEVREFVERRIGSDYLIPLYKVFVNEDEIDFAKMPKKVVFKPNHASGLIIMISDTNNVDLKLIKSRAHEWLKIDYYYMNREKQYKGIERKLLCEKDISAGVSLLDYKIFCFYGIPKFIQVDHDRHSNHTRNFYDVNWNKLDFTLLYPNSITSSEKPKNLEIMLTLANRLSSDHRFCRVDLYEVNGKVYFGELTFCPEGGCAPFSSFETDLKLGKYFYATN